MWVGVSDYQDPSTYLDILKTTSSENTKIFNGYDDPNNAAAAQVGLKDYDALLDSAASETTDINARYDRYAQAQAWLEDSSLIIPLTVCKRCSTSYLTFDTIYGC